MPAPTRPWFIFGFGGSARQVETGSIEFSMDAISGRAQVQFPGDYRNTDGLFPAVDVNQVCYINGGVSTSSGGRSLYQLFSGWIEEDGSSYTNTSLSNTLFMGDQLRLTQYPIGDPAQDLGNFDSTAYYQYLFDSAGVAVAGNNGPWTDITVVQDLLKRSGVTASLAGIGGQGVGMATALGFALKNTQTPAELIKQVDDATACQTFATPSGPRRIPTTYTPSLSARWTLREGYTGNPDGSTYAVLTIDNKRSMKDFFNRALVKGLVQGGSKLVSIRQATPNLPPVGGGGFLQLPFGRSSTLPMTHTFSSDLIQDQRMADNKSAQMLIIGNRIGRRVSVTTDFNPQAEPGQAVAVFAPHAKIYSTTVGYAWGVKHNWGTGGAWTTWDVAIYDGDSGSLPPAPNIALIN